MARAYDEFAHAASGRGTSVDRRSALPSTHPPTHHTVGNRTTLSRIFPDIPRKIPFLTSVLRRSTGCPPPDNGGAARSNSPRSPFTRTCGYLLGYPERRRFARSSQGRWDVRTGEIRSTDTVHPPTRKAELSRPR